LRFPGDCEARYWRAGGSLSVVIQGYAVTRYHITRKSKGGLP
jgi:hypothetical protein